MFGKLKKILGSGTADSDEEIADVEVQQTTAADPVAKTDGEADSEKALLAGELRAAQKIQMGLVPKTFPPIPGCLPFDLYAILEPAREIGGDFYDYWLNGRENLMLVIGDVSGKGIPAALFMAVCRTYLRAFSRSVKEPAKLVEYLNNEVSRHNETCMFVTLICAMVHIPTGTVTYANAGHNPPFLRKRDGTVSMLKVAEDMPVGFMHGTEFGTRTLKLDVGESLLFYTDGMPEAFTVDGEMLGEEQSLALFKASSAGGGCRTTIGQLRAEVSEFTAGAEQSDDITLLMYGQLEQKGAFDLTAGRDEVSDLEGDSAVFSLSNIKDALPNPGKGSINDDMGLSLSGL